MAEGQFLPPENVFLDLKAESKKQILDILSELAAEKFQRSQREIFETLTQRERLGSTGVGNGVAIPHGKLNSIEDIKVLFARFTCAVDYEALDNKPVDLVCLLLAPENSGSTHLKALARVSRAFRAEDAAYIMRKSTSKAEIAELF